MAKKILDILEQKGEVIAKLGGTMGRTAVIDASLENRIDISESLKPSESIARLEEICDVIYLLNHGKSEETGHAFGRIVLSHVKITKPLVQIERPTDGTIIPWTPNSKSYAEDIANILGMEVVEPPPIYKNIRKKNGRIYRKVSGVYPQENILVNGVVIGTSNSSEVEIVSENNKIIDLIGGTIKKHGIEKLERLGPIDLESALIKTGAIRRSSFKPRIGTKYKLLNNIKKIVIIDHSAEKSFEIAQNADIAVTVGDDTTAIAGSILYRLGIPIIGITDGDIDGIISKIHIPPKSMIIKLKSGNDDIVGKIIRTKLFNGKDLIELNNMSIEEFKESILKIANSKIIAIDTY